MSGTVKEQDKDIGAAWNELPPFVQRWLKAYETAAREREKKS